MRAEQLLGLHGELKVAFPGRACPLYLSGDSGTQGSQRCDLHLTWTSDLQSPGRFLSLACHFGAL